MHQLGKEGPDSLFQKYLLMFETCQESQCSLIDFIILVLLWMLPLYLLTWTKLSFSPEMADWIPWASWICHTRKQVLQLILCHWNMLAVVTFLKEIFRAAFITQKLWPVIYFEKAISLLCIREDVCLVFISSQSCVNRGHVIDNFNHMLQNIKFRWNYFD